MACSHCGREGHNIQSCPHMNRFERRMYYRERRRYDRRRRGDCFIATAAYGSPMDLELDLLRIWRDTELSNVYIGRAFIEVYYMLGPPIARFIEKRNALRTIVRIMLFFPITILKNRKKNNYFRMQ